MCTRMCMAALFTTAGTRKHLECLSVDEWREKMWIYIYIYIRWDIYAVEYYSAIRKKEILSFSIT